MAVYSFCICSRQAYNRLGDISVLAQKDSISTKCPQLFPSTVTASPSDDLRENDLGLVHELDAADA